MTDSQLLTLQDRVDAAKHRWRRAFVTGTDAQERTAYEKLRRLEREYQKALLKREVTL